MNNLFNFQKLLTHKVNLIMVLISVFIKFHQNCNSLTTYNQMLASHLAVLQTHSALKYSWILSFSLMFSMVQIHKCYHMHFSFPKFPKVKTARLILIYLPLNSVMQKKHFNKLTYITEHFNWSNDDDTMKIYSCSTYTVSYMQ